MPNIPGLRRFFRLPARPRGVEADVDDELRFHIEMRTQELVERGMTPDAARAEALRQFGDMDRVRSRVRAIATQRETEARRAELLDTLRQDLGYAARRLRKNPGFAALAILTLALGIGAGTAVFSVVRGVLIRPLPFAKPDELVRVWSVNPARDPMGGDFSVLDLQDWRAQTTALASLGGYSVQGLVLQGEDGPERLRAAHVDSGFFKTLGVPALIGRTILQEEHVDGQNRVVVLSEPFWRQRFGGDPTIVGRTLRMNNEPFTVVGVMPGDLRFPTEWVQAWTPTTIIPEDGIPRVRFVRWLNAIGRLKPGVSVARAEAELTAVAKRLEAQYPDANAGWNTARVRTLRDDMVGGVRPGLLILLGAVLLVVLIACVNVANLMLARASTRQREIAIRSALGAGRGRIVRQLLTESVLIALLAGALGVALAWWGTDTLLSIAVDALPRVTSVRIDAGVLWFALALSIGTGLAFGLVPALRAAGSDVQGTLREGARGATGAGSGHRTRAALVAAEVALAVVLVIGAGLMLRSFWRLTSVDPGFDPEHALLVRYSLPDIPGDTVTQSYQRHAPILERVRAVPGVLAAGSAKQAPLRGRGEPYSFTVPGRPAPAPGSEPTAETLPVSPDYFRAMGIALLAGRDIAATDTRTAPPVAVINETFARRHWPGESAIGKTVSVFGTEITVVGVVADVRTEGMDVPPDEVMYVPGTLMSRSSAALVVRTAGDPAAIAPAVRAAIRAVDPSVPITEMLPMRQIVSEAVATPRFFAVLISCFGGLALALAVVGLYGVVAYVVTQRTQEIGVRMALGAPAAGVVRLMMWRAMVPVLLGLLTGVAGALALTRLLGGLLYEVRPTDPLTYVAVAGALALSALAAAWLPSRRAARVDPVSALRAE